MKMTLWLSWCAWGGWELWKYEPELNDRGHWACDWCRESWSFDEPPAGLTHGDDPQIWKVVLTYDSFQLVDRKVEP